jgi:hypothetical protein
MGACTCSYKQTELLKTLKTFGKSFCEYVSFGNMIFSHRIQSPLRANVHDNFCDWRLHSLTSSRRTTQMLKNLKQNF